MKNSKGYETILPDDEMRDDLSRVRQLDRTIEEAAVRRYAREMQEADAVLNTIAAEDVPLVVAFSASWPEGNAR